MWIDVALPLPPDRLFTYKVPDTLSAQVQIGQSVLVPFYRKTFKGIIVRIVSQPSAITAKEIHSLLSPQTIVPDPLLKLTQWISEKYGCSWGEALASMSCPPPLRGGGEARQALLAGEGAGEKHQLTPEQQKASSQILHSIQTSENKTFLLFGVTSSGKTEVYLKAIEAVLKQGKQALFLVPEISLCVPFLEILKERFGTQVGIWHSQISARDKHLLFEQIRQNRSAIVVGARSALFVPFTRLGLIVVDEEHDNSYKQDEKPRYHARETAIKLAELHGASVILGSATPAIESYDRAVKQEFTLLELSQRIPSHSLPQITLIDRKKSGNGKTPLTPLLIEQLTKVLQRREQAILALNRRGFSTYLLCSVCGFVCQCPHCKLTLVHHKTAEEETSPAQNNLTFEPLPNHEQEVLKCHYCFFERTLPRSCENCRSQNLHLGGFGTQKIVQEIKKIFPFARVLRLDRDAMRKKSASAETYKAFREETADILVGTQMAAQGFDFPRVTLVGIIDADTALFHPDFRSAERTFQWVLQAAGRAGRSSMGGQAIVQSSLPDHYALTFGVQQNYKAFYEKEIEYRKMLGYPPFSKLVLFRVQSAGKKDWVVPESERLAQHLKSQTIAHKAEILGPGPAPREHVRKQLRWQILVKCADDEKVSAVVQAGRSFTAKAGVRITIDVDPCDLL